MVRLAWSAACVLALMGFWCAPLEGQESAAATPKQPLHERIDGCIEAAAVGPLAPLCDDADFVRRVYLDLTGVIPTANQARAFVADQAPDKRQRLIDELLASQAFVRHMTVSLDVMLMERKPEKAVKQPEWEAYLYQSLAADKRLDQLFRELIAADGADEKLRPAARFVLDRDAEPNLITRDIGRIVFGMDLQCCQCHDHPLINDYYQDDYYGLFAFVHRTSLFTDAKSKQISLTEKADGEASFKSVFTGASSDKALPRLPKGAVLFLEPTFAKGDEYSIKPDKTVRGVPKFSRRVALAEMIPGSREFARNLANRLWAQVFGRGIVHPVDFHHAGNPPSNARLLAILSDELSASSFQLRPFIRELTLTRVYQRSCDAPRPEIVNFADVAARLDGLTPENERQQQRLQPLKDSLAQAKAEYKAARDDDARLVAELTRLAQARDAARQALDKVAAERRVAEESAAKVRDQARAVAVAAEKLKEAKNSLPDDKVLTDALTKVGTLATELKVAAEVAQKTLAEKATQHDAAARRLADGESALAMATTARPTTDRLRELEQAQLTAEHKLSDARYSSATITAEMATAQAMLDYASLAETDAVKAAAAWSALVERWTIAGQVAPLKPLTPEQLAASAMQATDMFDGQVASAEAKLDKSPPDALKNAAEADKPRLRTNLVQTELLSQLRGTFSEFVRQYGGEPGQEFQATVNQALFFGNGNTIDGWLKPAGDNLIARLAKLDDASQVADEMSWAVYSRPASESDRLAAAAYLKDRSDKPIAIGEMLWALLSSTEFRFNH